MGNVYRDSVIDECIKAVEAALAEHEKSNEAQGLLHAMEFLETLKTSKPQQKAVEHDFRASTAVAGAVAETPAHFGIP